MSDDQQPFSKSHEDLTETYDSSIAPIHIPERIGRYHVTRLIASGGMGAVYEAVQENPRRIVALKVMKHVATSKVDWRRFEYESQLLSRLHHPGIAQVYEAGIHTDPSGPIPFFTMEYFPNAKSITAYANLKKFDIPQKLILFTQACEAVYQLHQKGIIHRDIKPGNILVDSSGQVKIIDLGIARSPDSDLVETEMQTAFGAAVGTMPYMSPEQCLLDPHDLDLRSDVYALGVVLYKLLTGQMPYGLDRTPRHEMRRMILEDPPTHLSSVDKSLRGDLEIIVEKALEKDRERRYQTATALAEDIKRYLNNEPILARPPSIPYRLNKFIHKQKVPLAIFAILIFAFGYAAYTQIRANRASLSANSMIRTYRVFFEAQAQTKAGLDKAQKVVQDCNRMIEQKPDFALAYALRAKALTLEGNNIAAWSDCVKALELDPTISLAQRTMGYLRLERGDFEGALEAYDKGIQVISLDEDLPRDFHNRARILHVLGEYELSLTDRDRAVALVPEEGLVYEGRGLTRRCLGDINGAIDDLTRAVYYDSTWGVQCNLWIWEMRMLRDERNDHKAAEEALAAAYKLAPDDDKIYVQICRGDINEPEVLQKVTSPQLQCYAYYYLGAKALVDGRQQDAQRLFELCRSTNEHSQDEYVMAGWHLQNLKTD